MPKLCHNILDIFKHYLSFFCIFKHFLNTNIEKIRQFLDTHVFFKTFFTHFLDTF